MPAANPRAACVRALRRWDGGKEFADDILHEALDAAQFTTLDRAFLTETFYGILKSLRVVDFLIESLRDEPVDSLTRQVLRLGLYQIFRMRIPDHAAVNETVNLAGRARGLVNAVLRRAIREHAELQAAIEKAPTAVRHSHPEFLIDRWQKHFGEEAARMLCEWNNQPARVFVRANGLKVTRGELLQTAPGAAPLDSHPLMIQVKQIPFLWIVHGLCYIQDPSTLIACELLSPQPGEKVLDACSAPGGKTSYLAQLMENQGQIVACDASAKRIERLNGNLQRLSVENTTVAQVDWLSGASPFPAATFDRILLDAPCSNTGVIRRRVDVRWRLSPADFDVMQQRQIALLRILAPLLKPGGTLVYSSCSLEPEENEKLVERAVAEIPGLRFLESRQSLPFRDGIDGAFSAKFERR